MPNIRSKAPANSNTSNRLHIGFNDEARKEYLNGFSKRKAERRRFGLAMGELKKKRQKLEDRRERRAIEKEGKEDISDDISVDVWLSNAIYFRLSSLGCCC